MPLSLVTVGSVWVANFIKAVKNAQQTYLSLLLNNLAYKLKSAVYRILLEARQFDTSIHNHGP